MGQRRGRSRSGGGRGRAAGRGRGRHRGGGRGGGGRRGGGRGGPQTKRELQAGGGGWVEGQATQVVHGRKGPDVLRVRSQGGRHEVVPQLGGNGSAGQVRDATEPVHRAGTVRVAHPHGGRQVGRVADEPGVAGMLGCP